jgi:hypothetical protein
MNLRLHAHEASRLESLVRKHMKGSKRDALILAKIAAARRGRKPNLRLIKTLRSALDRKLGICSAVRSAAREFRDVSKAEFVAAAEVLNINKHTAYRQFSIATREAA